LNGNNWETFGLTTINNTTTLSYTDNIADTSLTDSSGVGTYHTNTTNKQITVNGARALFVDTNLTAVGLGAAANITSGGANTIIGQGTGSQLTTGTENTFVGASAGRSLTQGGANTIVGYEMAPSMTGGSGNALFGHRTLYKSTIGTNNTVMGYSTLGYNGAAGSTITETVAIGAYAGYNMGTASYNTLIGNNSGRSLTTGSQNIFLGYQSGYWETGSNKFMVSNQQYANEATARTNSLFYGVMAATPAAQTLAINATTTATQYNLSALNTAPASATAAGTLGEVRWANGFVYLCVATNTWQRAALATW